MSGSSLTPAMRLRNPSASCHGAPQPLMQRCSLRPRANCHRPAFTQALMAAWQLTGPGRKPWQGLR
eukprot:5769755-Lingulodinium_polyedra.AAC.1